MEPVILLIVLGIILFLVETFVLPGIGVAGILGVGSLAAACWFAWTNFGNRGMIITIIICGGLVLGFSIWFLSARTWKRFALKDNIESKVDETPQNKGLGVGMEGVTLTRLNPMGRARFGETDVEVHSEDGMVAPRTEVTISRIEEEKIFIKIK